VSNKKIWIPLIIIDAISVALYMWGKLSPLKASVRIITGAWKGNAFAKYMLKLLVNPLVVIAITTVVGILLTMVITTKYYASKDIYAASRESAMQDVRSSEKASDVIIEGIVHEEPSDKGNKMDVF
jgi:hypothetical protein